MWWLKSSRLQVPEMVCFTEKAPALDWGLFSERQKRELLEVISNAEGEQRRSETVGREAHPFLILVIGACIEVLQNSVVQASSNSEQVVCEVGVLVAGECWEVEDATAIHHFAVW